MKLQLYLHTLKYLKFSQLYYRIFKRFVKPSPNTFTGKCREVLGEWLTYPIYEQKYFTNNRFRFLNEDGYVNSPEDWNDDSRTKLWLYNLHYFDDLCAVDSGNRVVHQVELIKKWIKENPAPTGNGWEPYPSSLRIVNWIKFFLSGHSPEQYVLDSLAQQIDFLSQNLERHILGNHLFANAKALIFAGLFLNNKDADCWFQLGVDVFQNELAEQVLADGGNFELTPMYHSIILLDLLDLINIFTAYPGKVDSIIVDKTKDAATKMLDWLQVMIHEDGEISFFNDSAIGVTANPSKIFFYAKRLGLKLPLKKSGKLIQLQASGYSRINMPTHSTYFDHAKVGPNYLPGHAHADSLSIEWSVGSQRVLVNSGTSLYGLSAERHRQRQTAAHNTVVVDGEDSSEVWSSFRVARRAYITKLVSEETEDWVRISAAHDGYMRLKGKVTHTREIFAKPDKLNIQDKLQGTFVTAVAMFHLHPTVKTLRIDEFSIRLSLPNGMIILVQSSDKIIESNSFWFPEFGKSVPNLRLSIPFSSSDLNTSFILDGQYQ